MMPSGPSEHKTLGGGSALSHALAYARMGWEVLPCRPVDQVYGGRAYKAKSPYTDHGMKDATTNPRMIEWWWGRRPDALIGVRPAPGLVVLDVDPRNGGDESLRALLDRHGPLPETATARTGGGGWHIWFRCERVSVGVLAAGVDVKTRKGYVIVPPSPHPSGGMYEWERVGAIAHAPLWLRALLDPPLPSGLSRASSARGPGDGSALVEFVASLKTGNRNNGLYWAACQAAKEGSLPTIEHDMADAAVSSGMSEAEARATIRSAQRRAGDAGA
jgi:hypothetical protein